MVFSGEEVNLRPVKKSDLERLVIWSNDSEVDCFMDGAVPRSLDESHIWLEQIKKDRHVRRYAIETRNGVLIGEIALDQIAWRSGDAELTVRIGEKDYWGKGYGSDAVLTVLDIAFNKLGLNRIYLRVYSFNKRAIRCYEKCGFKKEGILRRQSRDASNWKEIVLMRKLSHEHVSRSIRDAS